MNFEKYLASINDPIAKVITVVQDPQNSSTQELQNFRSPWHNFFPSLTMEIRQNKEYRLKDNDRLWRYTDLHQLLYFIITRNIFFAPLSSFDDPLEGISGKYVEAYTAGPADRKQDFQFNEARLHQVQERLFASCWFLGDNESMAMWETHSNPDSVAIEFNAEKLKNLIVSRAVEINNGQFRTLWHGKVDYIRLSPFEEKSLKQNDHGAIGFLKDMSYKHEEEFRFITLQSKNTGANIRGFDLGVGQLNALEFNIITHPKMEDWKHENLAELLDRFSLKEKLKCSDIVARRN